VESKSSRQPGDDVTTVFKQRDIRRVMPSTAENKRIGIQTVEKRGFYNSAHFTSEFPDRCHKFSSRSRHVAASIGECGPPEERDRVFVRAKIPHLVHNVLRCLSVLVQIFARKIVLGHLVRADLRFVSAFGVLHPRHNVGLESVTFFE
jgi:hypothetical protein